MRSNHVRPGTTGRHLVLALLAAGALHGAAEQGRAGDAGAFLRDLAGRERVTQADAIEAAAIFTGERAHAADLAACRRRLEDRKILLARDDAQPAQVLRKGFACLLFARAMHLSGGLKVRLLGWSARLAYQELAFMEMVPAGGEHDRMTGAELLSLFREAQAQVHAPGT